MPNGSKGSRSYSEEEWNHIQIQVWQGEVWWRVYWESSRTFGERFREHQKAPSPIYDHFNFTGHNVTIDNFSMMGREDQNIIGTIKEPLDIRVIIHPWIGNIGKYHLPHIWDEVLFNTSELKIKQKLSGYSTCHISNNIYQHITHPEVATPSATLAITPAI